MPVIEVNGLTKRFGDITAVSNLTLQVEEGEVLGFLGPNGSGKTTTIRMLAGIISPTGGNAVIAGHQIPGDAEAVHEVVGLLTETPGFYERLSAVLNLKYFAGFYAGLDIDAQVEKHLKLIGLWERRDDRVGTYSKGMKQRLAIARALLHEPKILFLDEPTAGLDPEVSRDIRQLIKRLSSEGRTIFLSTHNLAEAEELCNRIAVIRTHLLALDTGENLRNRYFRRQIIVRLSNLSDAILEAVRKLPCVRNLCVENEALTVELLDTEQNRPELVNTIVNAGGQVMEVSENRQPLEEVYFKLIHEGENSGA